MNLPGTIYLNRYRYWWVIRLPGTAKRQHIPLRPPGSRHATQDRETAELIAAELWAKHLVTSRYPILYDGRLNTLVRIYHARNLQYYLPPSTRADNIRYAIFPLAEFCPDVPANEFSPLDLKRFRRYVIESGKYDWCRQLINQRIGEVKQMFRWAASETLVSVHTYTALATVDGLQRGRTTAREGRRIRPVKDSDIEAVLNTVTPLIGDMIRVQLLTGMRPGELVQMRPADIDRDESIWIYRPENHKTSYRGQVRTIRIGPKAQAVLAPYLLALPNEYCFRPAESERQARDRKHESRRTPLQHGNRPGSNNRHIRAFNDRFDVGSYRRAITRACRKAGIEPWHPHQLRHTAATRIRRQIGLDAARAVLGHTNIKMTDEYAEIDQSLASDAARKLG